MYWGNKVKGEKHPCIILFNSVCDHQKCKIEGILGNLNIKRYICSAINFEGL